MLNKLKTRHIRILTICTCGLLTVAGFQNFSVIPIENLKLARLAPTASIALASASSGNATDIRAWAPNRPSGFSSEQESDKQTLAIPQSGNTLESVGQDWALRQTHLITDGADERFLNDVNQKVKHLFDSEGDREPASEASTAATAALEPSAEEPSAFSALRFSALNRVEMRAPGQTNLSCSVAGANLLVNLSKPISDRMDVSLQHQTSSGASTLRLHYNW